MTKTSEHASSLTLPIIPIYGTVVFPGGTLQTEFNKPETIAALETALASDKALFLLTQKETERKIELKEKNFYKVGCVCHIRKVEKKSDTCFEVSLEGSCRAKLLSFQEKKAYTLANVVCVTVKQDAPSTKQLSMRKHAQHLLESFKKIHPTLDDALLSTACSIENIGLFADLVAAAVFFDYKSKQKILEAFSPDKRIERLVFFLEQERDLIEAENRIQKEVRKNIDEHHKEFFLREQLRAVQQELGEDGDEILEYAEQIKKAKLSEEIEKKLHKELNRLAKTPYNSPDAAILRNYIETCLDLPWSTLSQTNATLDYAKNILEADHDGLTKVKERILESIAIKSLAPQTKNQILCLVGPPGVGKTSIAQSIAKATRRKYVRISLGGIRDEADIRGHRKTYIGAMPGRIIDALVHAGTRNPLIVLDEIDKLSASLHGDPASALLEVLDPEQNKVFRDHFIELPIDLSDCLFIATANDFDGIPTPLLDRMEVIELHAYTRSEKTAIAKNHLIPKQQKRHGLKKRQVAFTDTGIEELIDFYTREAGVRNLEREIASLFRKSAKEILETAVKSVLLTPEKINSFLGKRKFLRENVSPNAQIGIVNGMAYTQSGGDLLKVEVALMQGDGKIKLTGSLGDVMKESAQLAISYVRAHAEEFNINPSFYKTTDIHIHFPEGAIPKDGPSAGVTMTTALFSALTSRPCRSDIAMTGEISLSGRVLAIGGLREKTMAAYAAGVRTIYIPKYNERDIYEVDSLVKDNVKFVFCHTIQDILTEVLLPKTELKEKTSPIPEYPLFSNTMSSIPKSSSPNELL